MFTNADGAVTVEALPDARTFVNGKRVPPDSPIKLLNGFRVILGDFHVFRFNDPEAVRLERQKLIGSPDTRPDSPNRLNDEFMDWSAARREVADIEKLGDQDLDKLYDDIVSLTFKYVIDEQVKVRTQRRRPDSRVDLAELESRFMASSHNGETPENNGNPWAGPLEATLTTNSIQTPLAIEPPDPVEVEDQSESDVNVSGTSLEPAIQLRSKGDSESLENQHLTRQLKTLAQEVKRMRSQAAAARALAKDVLDPADWTETQMRYAQMAVARWKRLRTFKMAEQILTGAVEIREANVIASVFLAISVGKRK